MVISYGKMYTFAFLHFLYSFKELIGFFYRASYQGSNSGICI